MSSRNILLLFFFVTTLAVLLVEETTQTSPDRDPRENTARSAEEDEVEQATIVFVGDMMFDRYIRRSAEDRGSYSFILDDFTEDFRDADGVVGNLEGPITEHQSISVNTTTADPGHFAFTFDPAVADLLADTNFRAASIGNNHSTNFGREGVAATRNFLDSAHIEWFGDPYDSSRRSANIDIGEQRFTFVGFNQFLDPSLEETLEHIRAAEDTADWTVVYAHWGDEYEHEPNPREVERAHAFVDAGADLVIGAHPHVIQTSETYADAPIYYSLGNFVFDQYFREDVRCGLMLTALFRSDGTLSIEESTSYLQADGTTIKKECR